MSKPKTEPEIDFRCECDTPERDRFVVTSHDGDESHVLYCRACQELAEADWTGETAEIRRWGASTPNVPAPSVQTLRAATVGSRIGKWFDDHGWQGIGESIIEYVPTEDYPPSRFLANLHIDLNNAEAYDDDDPTPSLYATARNKLAELARLYVTSGSPAPKGGLKVSIVKGGRSGREYRAVLIGARGYEVARITLQSTPEAARESAMAEWGPLPYAAGSL